MLTVNQVCGWLGVGKSTIERGLYLGQFPQPEVAPRARKFGRRWAEAQISRYARKRDFMALGRSASTLEKRLMRSMVELARSGAALEAADVHLQMLPAFDGLAVQLNGRASAAWIVALAGDRWAPDVRSLPPNPLFFVIEDLSVEQIDDLIARGRKPDA